MNTTNYDKILNYVKDINNDLYKFKNKKAFENMTFDEFEQEMITKYNELHTSYNFIFNRAISGELDMNMFSYMINKAKSVQKNTISNFEASKQIGTKLVDTFIKPELEKNKNKN